MSGYWADVYGATYGDVYGEWIETGDSAMAGTSTDYYGHPSPSSAGPGGTALAAAASGSAAGTIVPGGTVVTAEPGNVSANDQAGQFTVAIASGEGSTAGILATVYFANPYSAVPKAVLVGGYDSTTSGTPCPTLAVKPVSAGLQAGFSIYVGASPALTAADTVTLYFTVIP